MNTLLQLWTRFEIYSFAIDSYLARVSGNSDAQALAEELKTAAEGRLLKLQINS